MALELPPDAPLSFVCCVLAGGRGFEVWVHLKSVLKDLVFDLAAWGNFWTDDAIEGAHIPITNNNWRPRHITIGKCTRWVVTTSSETELTRENLTPRLAQGSKGTILYALRTSSDLA